MMDRKWIWKSIVASLCGIAAHSLLMYFKAASGLLPTFQPYHSLQLTLSRMTGDDVSPLVPWLLSYLNGLTIAGFGFARSYSYLPGGHGAVKGLLFGIAMWLVMGTVFFPLIGLGFFGAGTGLGIRPAVFSLAMLLTYSVVMGFVYQRLRN